VKVLRKGCRNGLGTKGGVPEDFRSPSGWTASLVSLLSLFVPPQGQTRPYSLALPRLQSHSDSPGKSGKGMVRGHPRVGNPK